MQENHRESARLYAEFARVAERNEVAWNQGNANGEEVIGTVSKRNRMICYPCKLRSHRMWDVRLLTDSTDPLLMNAFNTVNLAAAVILTSVSTAQSLGIPSSKWIYPLAGAGTQDSVEFWHRPSFYSSPSISRSIDTSLDLSGLSKSEIDIIDIYSCFPIVPKIAAQHLGLPITGGSKALTVLGGLTSFGGAGNNYSMHALTEVTRQIRAGKGKNGLVLCNGGVLSYQYVVVLSMSPRKRGEYPMSNPLPSVITDVPSPEVLADAVGEAVVEVGSSRSPRHSRTFLIESFC